MIKMGGGSIINVTSLLGLIGSVKPAYAACKGGIITFTKTLAAQQVQYGIRANAIGPGSVRTEHTLARYDKKTDQPAVKTAITARERETIQKLYPFSKGEPDDIAAIGVFLASDESRMITGTTIAADGGRPSYLKVYAEE